MNSFSAAFRHAPEPMTLPECACTLRDTQIQEKYEHAVLENADEFVSLARSRALRPTDRRGRRCIHELLSSQRA